MISIGDPFGEVSKQLRLLKHFTFETFHFLAVVCSFVLSPSKDDKSVWTRSVTETRSKVSGDVGEPEGS